MNTRRCRPGVGRGARRVFLALALLANAGCAPGAGSLRFAAASGTVEFLPTSGITAVESGGWYAFRSIGTGETVAYLLWPGCLGFEGTGEKDAVETIGGIPFDRVRVSLGANLGYGTSWQFFVSGRVGRVSAFYVVQLDRDRSPQNRRLVQQILRAIKISPP